MIRKLLGVAAAVAMSVGIAGCGTPAVTSEADVRRMPMFEVDSAWPKMPAKWQLGHASSIAIDAQDNV